MALVVANIRNSSIPRALGGLCPDDPRILGWLNEAQERLLGQGRFWGSIRQAQFCAVRDCITWPREVATIEQLAVCGSPIGIVNQWYQYTQNLARIQNCEGCSPCGGESCSNSSCSCGHLQAQDQDTAPSFATTTGENKKIRVYPGSAADNGKTIIIQGYDINGLWVRTNDSGTQIDGEKITLALPYVTTTTVWGAGTPTGIIKEVTQFLVRLYEYDTETEVERALAIYQPGETLPSYRRSIIPGLSSVNCGPCCTEDEDGNPTKTVTALVSLGHVELISDNDWLVLGNLSAYKEAMMAVKAWEDDNIALANFHFYGTQASPSNGRGVLRVVNRGGAIPLLQAELRKFTGDRFTAYAHIDPSMRFPRQMAGFI